MPLKAVVDSLDDMPEAVRSYYRPGDGEAMNGRFVLDVEGADGYALEDIGGLKNAFHATKTDLEKSKAALEGYKGLPAASTLKERLKELEKLKQFDPEVEADKIAKARLNSALEEAGSRHKTEIDEARAESDRLWTALNGALVSSSAKDSIIKEGGSPALLMPHVRARTKVDRETLTVTVLKDDGTPLYSNKGQPATIDDLIADLKKHPDYGRAFEATASGSGASGAKAANAGFTGKNPYAKATFNLTEQMKLIKADPQRAAYLKAVAEQH